MELRCDPFSLNLVCRSSFSLSVSDVLKSESVIEGGAPDILSSIVDSKELRVSTRYGRHIPLTKKQGVSGESACTYDYEDFQIQKHEKDFKSKQLIKEAIMENDFLKNLDSSQVREIVDCMYCQYFTKGTQVIKEGDVGSHLYVSAEGNLRVLKRSKVIGSVGPGKAFGELAILYNCTRTATVEALEDAKIWVMDRKAFHAIMMKTGLQRQEDNIKFLRRVTCSSHSLIGGSSSRRPLKWSKIVKSSDIESFITRSALVAGE
ncbi:cGMP-dependent protein kinase, isozyme 1 [Araneus ventricosus]|uniref:cGMP-dependent protein kinase, isozyme 1 n=1 Tax=Araneus ventricosus TaxID=182803 RepID=A0A4Y2BIM3_ARAVE|nr:cGMP-dependent protein kinase, isozyme 1 [Araneus ventricosus]